MTQFLSQNRDMSESIQKCLKCQEVCIRTMALGLEMNEDQDFITSLQLCAQACQLSAQAMLLESTFYSKACGFTADICDSLADFCENFDEPEIRDCGRLCRDCARSCRAMIQHSASNQNFQADIRLV